MTFPLVIWGKAEWVEERQLPKNKVIWFFVVVYQSLVKNRTPLRIGVMEGSPPAFPVPHFPEFLLRLQHGKWLLHFSFPEKHFQSHSFEMKVQVQLSTEKGIRSNVLKLLGILGHTQYHGPLRSRSPEGFPRTWEVQVALFLLLAGVRAGDQTKIIKRQDRKKKMF